MEIKVKKNGYKVGTSGWLLEQLKSGDLVLSEGITQKDEMHALFLKSKSKDFYRILAALGTKCYGNPFEKCEYCVNFSKTWFVSVHHDFDGKPGYFTQRAWDALIEVAQEWCDELNEERRNDKTIKLKIIRVEEAVK